MLTEQECKTALLQSMIIWNTTKDEICKEDDSDIDFSSQTTRQQTPVISYMECIINKAAKDEKKSLYQELTKVIDDSVIAVYFPVIKFSIEVYSKSEKRDKDLKLHQGKSQTYEKEIQAIIDATPEGLPKITDSLTAADFELLVLLVIGYSKYEHFGEAMQKLICYLDVVSTSMELFEMYTEHLDSE